MGLFSNGKCNSKARLDGKTAVITGANAGIGFETARDFVKRGCRVVLACRNAQKADAAAEKLVTEVAGAQVRVVHLDLASLNSVKQCAELLNRTEDSIHLLINNAGIVSDYAVSEDGYEMTFQCNHLSHFLLTLLLLDKIKQSAPARIVNVSSLAHIGGRVNFEDLQSTKSYGSTNAYNQSKLCNVLFTLELQNRLQDTSVVAYCLHPGVVSTDIFENMPNSCYRTFMLKSRWMMKSASDGAQTTIMCAVDEKLAQQNGFYFSDCKESRASSSGRNKDDAAKLWKVSEQLVQTFLN